jgi:hypothetical protein
MKKTKFFRYAALVLAAACALILAGCPTNADDPDPDPALRGNWTNKVGDLHGGLVKDFAINDNFTFTASINPTFIGAYNEAYGVALPGGAEAANTAGLAALAVLEQQPGTTDAATRWTVTGKLTADGGSVYIMSNLMETSVPPKPALSMPGKTAAEEVLGFSNRPVKITFSNDKTAFNFESAEKGALADKITLFFGGNYTRKK